MGLAQPFDIQAGIFHTGTLLEVKAIPTTGINNLVLGGVNFTIRWPNSYNVSLGAAAGPFGIPKNGGEGTAIDGPTNYRYQKFSHIVNQNVTWTAGQPYLLLTVPVNQTGVGTGSFELAQSTFLPGQGEEWYIEIGGFERTNPVFNPGITVEVLLPVELSSFSATLNGNNINLHWQTKTEINNYGFEIERKIGSKELRSENWEKIGFIQGSGNSNSQKDYMFADKNPIGGSRFIYRLKQIDNTGSFEYSNQVEIEIIPDKFELFQNYPNPFNPETIIKFAAPRAGKIILSVYNVLGEKVKDLADGFFEPGIYNVLFDGKEFSSGLYIYRIQTENFIQVKKMQLIR